MSPRPGRIVARYDVDFVRRFAKDGDWRPIKIDPEFVRLREEIRGLIHSSDAGDARAQKLAAYV
jgi:taurine transport system ATP-binding protein